MNCTSDSEEDILDCSYCSKGITYDDCIHYEEDVYLCMKCGEGKENICIECYRRPCGCEPSDEELLKMMWEREMKGRKEKLELLSGMRTINEAAMIKYELNQLTFEEWSKEFVI